MSLGIPVDDATRERLVEAARLAGIARLVPSVVHQLNTPLAAIALRAESLERAAAALEESEVSARVRRHLKAFHEEAFRCKELLSALQFIIRPPASRDERIDLNNLCRRLGLLLQHEAMRRQVNLILRLTESVPLVVGDESSLGQIALALVSNALAASPEGAQVVLETTVEGNQVMLAVTDPGPGVPASVAERLFEPFVSSHTPSIGLGLGLTGCRAEAAAHGGEVSWQPVAEGGTRFLLTLPRAARIHR